MNIDYYKKLLYISINGASIIEPKEIDEDNTKMYPSYESEFKENLSIFQED